MSESEESTSSTQTVDKLVHKYEDALHGHKQLTSDELSKLRREMQDALRDEREASERSLKELKEALEDVTGWITEQREASKNKDSVKDSESTIVVPPNDVSPPTPAEVPDTTVHGDEEGAKKGGWKRFW